ncbi:D-2-hydroxyacid dehydrogenase [Microvirga rosea]|uniref:D-2-hydroxyacid dehydrogenase n=1 Tax=Microvirga rosea TaxID=2715425 RepID=UPI001D0A18AA|nr:D-2-hydroxyacid dehydrogenase [Microvirga rosea]MCB8822258.1 D-2-hydroxyacid dehydrogenase [Microvirga rosea]
MTSSPSHVVFITSPLEYEHVERIRAAAPECTEVLYEPDLLPPTRYVADHKGRDGFVRTQSQETRWREALSRATILWDFPSGSQGTRGLSLAPQVKWVQTTSSGVGQAVASMGLAETDVIVTTARGVHADALAEFAIFVMLAHVKDLPRLQRDQQAHRWERYCCGELSGKSLTIIGAGQVGARVACLARAFNMRVNAVVNRPSPERRDELFADAVFGQSDLKTAVSNADYIVLATPHTPQTERMIDASVWAATKKGVVFINIARGQVVDEPAMIQALADGHIGMAGLDVATTEPLPPGSPLWSMPNVMISPHSASTAPSENRKITDIFIQNLNHYVRGEPDRMINVLDKARMY